ncbi:MAG TPA: methyltransferase domain-containing protein [Candidatus Dormibacteraeota bacterium]|nr:methyltransferase domain-containing protein [Candidatus Dormibacteraeota bacterium]
MTRELGHGSFFTNDSREYELHYSERHYRRLQEIFRLVAKASPTQGNLLDIGTTQFTFLLKKLTPHKIFTIDYTSGFRQRCADHDIAFETHDITSPALPFGGQRFDLIVFTEVFEHLLANPVRVFSKLKSMLTDNGSLIVGTPNLASLQKRILLLLNRPILDWPTWEVGDEDIHGHGHNRIYVRKELTAFIEKAGLTVTVAGYSLSMDFTEPQAGPWLNAAKLLLLGPKLLVPSFRWGIHMVARNKQGR